MSVGHAFQDVLEIGEGLDVVELGGGEERGDDRPAGRAAVGSGEQMVLAAECGRPNSTFDGVVIELNATVTEEPAESFPSGQRVTDGVGESTFWREAIELCFEPDLHGLDQRQRFGPSCRLSCRGRLASDDRLNRIKFSDAPERFRRDRLGGRLVDFLKLPSDVGPIGCKHDDAVFGQPLIAGIAVDLNDALELCQMCNRVLGPAIRLHGVGPQGRRNGPPDPSLRSRVGRFPFRCATPYGVADQSALWERAAKLPRS